MVLSCGQFGNDVGRVYPERIPLPAYCETFAQVYVGKKKPLSKKMVLNPVLD